MIPHDPRIAAVVKQGRLVSFDPALNHPAVAAFDDGVLVHASRVKVPVAFAQLGVGERASKVAALCAAHVRALHGPFPSHFVFELPQVYVHGQSKGDPADLIALALVAGGLAALLDLPTYSPVPGAWAVGKKNTKGDVLKSPRTAIVKSRLTPEEFARIVLSHDAIDAAGIGKWLLGGFARRGIGAT